MPKGRLEIGPEKGGSACTASAWHTFGGDARAMPHAPRPRSPRKVARTPRAQPLTAGRTQGVNVGTVANAGAASI
eukprot:3031270-Alexandrium_andersonii.AAC.1